MTGRTHLIGGLLAGLATATVLSVGNPVVLAAAATLAGPLPDIDHPGSMYGRYVPLPGIVVRNGQLESWLPLHGFHFHQGGRAGRMFPGRGIVWHRGPTHSLAATVVFGVFVWTVLHFVSPSLAVPAALGAVAGYLSHLLLDMLNISPVALWWPFRKRGVLFGFSRIKVGSSSEKMLGVVMIAAVVLLVGSYVQEMLLR